METADWCVIGLGTVLAATGFGLVMSARGNTEPDARVRFRLYVARTLPLFMGLSMVANTLPRRLGAQYPVVMVFDAVGAVLVVAMGVLLATERKRLRAGPAPARVAGRPPAEEPGRGVSV
ncbi:hypothetical protein QMK19_15925 [Streptomyces sp. H10-C2]|uniref:hypothetical protein n=1 Tax=unclassified Streptomyces TaxID=2593676 RepID=UPI0024B880D0|nr:MULTISPECIES: hypothetical protein [unclassified Streptomyces]MDJ0346183.1 hypothetical protein [Streptomyces sp. PH10-H1]MDJ0371134.1 hypothetical protein [Streptomyces sp. H10-C2]